MGSNVFLTLHQLQSQAFENGLFALLVTDSLCKSHTGKERKMGPEDSFPNQHFHL